MKNKKKNRDEILDEIKKLSEQAETENDFSLDIDTTDLDVENSDLSFLNDTQNPKKSHKLYYSIQGIIKANLPKGQEFKKLREYVNEEKLIFLNQGAKKNARGVRGSDSRQSYTALLNIALDTVIEWVKSGANAFELFLQFRELNIQYGYHDESEIDKVSDYDEHLSGSTEEE